MASTTFTDKQTVINTTWLNDVNSLVWGVFSGATTVSAVKAILGISGGGLPSTNQGDTLYASAANTVSALAKDTNATRYLSNTGASNNPAWAQIALTTGVSGILPVANGGTNASSASITAFNNITGYSAAGATGTTSTNLVFSTSPAITTPTLTNPTVTNYTESVVAIGNSGTAQTLSLTSGTVQTVTMTGNCTFTMPSVGAGKSFVLIISTGAGSFTGTFTSVKWPGGAAPTLTATASKFDIVSFFSDGTNWYGNISQAYA